MVTSCRHLALAAAALVALHAAPAAAARFVFTALVPPNDIYGATVFGIYQDQAVGLTYTSNGTIGFAWSAGNYTYLPGISNFSNISSTGLVFGSAPNEPSSGYIIYNMATGVTNSYNYAPSGNSIFLHGGINADGTIAATQATPVGKSGKVYRYQAFEQALDGSYAWLSKPKKESDALIADGLDDNGTAVLQLGFSPASPPYIIVKQGRHKSFSIPNSIYTEVYFVRGNKFGGYYQDAKTKHYVGFVSDGSKTVTYAPPPPAKSTAVFGVGERGEVVGSTNDASGNNIGFIYVKGTYHMISYPKSSATQITGISSTGAIIGTYYDNGINGIFIATCPSHKVCTK